MLIVAGFSAIAIAAPVKVIGKHTGREATAATVAASGGDFTVHMAGLKFAPTDLVVRRDTTVTFDNNDLAPHTVTVTSQVLFARSGTVHHGAREVS
jgi:plastocyanin